MPVYWPISGPQGIPGTPGTNGTNGTNGTDGATWYNGAGAPGAGLGVVNDFYVDNTAPNNYYKKTGVATWTLQGHFQGATGATGATGAAGAAGSVWYNGAGAPGGGLGIIGDYYINTTTADYYTKTGVATWTLLGTLTGGGGGTGNLSTSGSPWITNGTSFFGPLFTAPVDPTVPAVATWAWVNQSTSTAVDISGGGISLQIANNAALNWRMLTKTIAPPYTATFYLRSAQQSNINSQTVGVYFYDGTKLLGIEGLSNGTTTGLLRVEKMNSVNSDNSTAVALGASNTAHPEWGNIWLRLGNDGVNLTLSYSFDGNIFITLFSEAVGAFLTPTKIGFGGVSVNAGAVNNPYVVLLGYYTQ